MAEEDESQKTEEPTPRKLAKAREEGQVAQSQEIKSWAILLGGVIALIFMFPAIGGHVALVGNRIIEGSGNIPSDFEHLRLFFSGLLLDLLITLGPFLIFIYVVAVFSNIGQFGLNASIKKIQPKWSKVNPVSGFKRVFGAQAVIEFVKGITKIGIVGFISFALAIPLLGDLEVVTDISFRETLERISDIAVIMAVATVGVMTVIAALDFSWQKHRHVKQLRMSRQEVKEENKQTQGDPQIKARIRQLRVERTRQRIAQAVPEADVVITNPTHYAVALEYKMDEMTAPKLVAKGVDHLAFRIRELADENDVPIVENPPLARALYASVEIDQEIPPEHFKAVAEVIGYVWRLKGKTPSAAPARR